jgi:hypothetical protein
MAVKTTTLCGMLVSLTLTPWPVQAHDIYGNLVGIHGESCCQGTDCRPAPWRIVNGSVEMYVNGKWISVHDEAIQYRTLDGDDGKTNGGHWCGVPLGSDIFVTFCAVLPPRSSDLK